MTDFACPAEIAALFDHEATAAEGRLRAIAWARDLPMALGDRVWLPEIGWSEKTAGSA